MKTLRISCQIGMIWTAVLFAACSSLCADTPVTAEKYRGFTIDDSLVQNMANLEAVRTAIKEQIDIVCVVGVSTQTLAFFQTVPLKIVPMGTIARGSPGLYAQKDKSVKIVSGITGVGHKPVLLHEYLHAYHDQRMEGRFRNPVVLDYYQHARTLNAFAANSHMMDNAQEFFACSATTYLFGVTAQEPFQRDKIKDKQPDVFEYLKKLFGPDAGSYAGSLTRKDEK